MIFGKIPIRINPLFWLMASAIGFLYAGDLAGIIMWIGIILVSVIVHELGHALTALAYGQKVSIELMVLGGVTQRQGPALSLPKEFLVVLNGPLAGLLLAFVSYECFVLVGDRSPILSTILRWTTAANIFWTVINLLPIQPLDGGKLLLIIMEGFFGLIGVKIALFFSIILAVLLSLYFFAQGGLLIGSILLMLAFESYRTWSGSLVMTEKDRDQELQSQFHAAEQLVKIGQNAEAERILKNIRGKVTSGFLYLASTEMLGQLAASDGNFEQAYDLLHSIESKLTDESLSLLHQLAYRTGHLQHAVAIGDRAYQNIPSYETAVLNSFAHAVMGEVQPAIGWLRCAVEEGLPDIQQIIRQKEFDNIRQKPEFIDYVASLAK
ncbi:MAG: site-2 protease family protein [Chlamydiales bacterium]|nr:site-2 protease family protein [Chlamydiales bacterium]